MYSVFNIFKKKEKIALDAPALDDFAEDLSKKLEDIQNTIIPVLEQSGYPPFHLAMALILMTERIAEYMKKDKIGSHFKNDIDRSLDHFRKTVRSSQKI
jgi:hypothetical protein